MATAKKELTKITPQIMKYVEQCSNTTYIEPEMYIKFDVKRGLRDVNGKGVVAGLTEISEINSFIDNPDGTRTPCDGELYYRGININDLVNGFLSDNRQGYEETVYLLLFGNLPNESELKEFRELLNKYRSLPKNFVRDVLMKASGKDMMNVLARSVLTLYAYDDKADDTSIPNVLRQCLQLISEMPLLAVYAYRSYLYYEKKKSLIIRRPKPEYSTAENILYMLRKDGSFTPLEAKILDLALVLHAEHGGGNNSTFATRVLTSSGTDTYAAIAAGIGSLKGPKHGGANSKVSEMIGHFNENVNDITNEGQVADFLRKIIRKEAGDGSGLVYGMGHAVYTLSDPRAKILKAKAQEFSAGTEFEKDFALLNLIETLTPEIFAEVKGNSKAMCANVDLYSGLIYKMLSIPADLYTPMFTVARVAGWSAHRIEEILTGGKIIRPAYKNINDVHTYIPLEKR